MRAIAVIALWGLLSLVSVWGYNPLSAEKQAELKLRSESSPAERRLSDILKRQQAMIAAAPSLPSADLSRQLSELASDYASLANAYPNDIVVLLHYGKFLRTVGEDDRALPVFERIAIKDPSIAVAFQQIASIQAESGRYHQAWQNFQNCLRLAPDTALYHFQFGEFVQVYRDHLVGDGLIGMMEVDSRMQSAFARARQLDPTSQTVAWRYAQSFYDVANPDWKAALAAWDKAQSLTTDPLELPILRMHRARCLIEMGDKNAAQSLLEIPVPPALEKTRDDLLKAARAA